MRGVKTKLILITLPVLLFVIYYIMFCRTETETNSHFITICLSKADTLKVNECESFFYLKRVDVELRGETVAVFPKTTTAYNIFNSDRTTSVSIKLPAGVKFVLLGDKTYPVKDLHTCN